MADTGTRGGPLVGGIILAVVLGVLAIAATDAASPADAVRRAAPWFGLDAPAPGQVPGAGTPTETETAGPAASVDQPTTFREARAADSAYVRDYLTGNWLAVVAWFQPQGKSAAERDAAFAKHLAWRESESGKLLVGAKSEGAPPAWVTVAPLTYATAEQARTWCDVHIERPCRAVKLTGDPPTITSLVDP